MFSQNAPAASHLDGWQLPCPAHPPNDGRVDLQKPRGIVFGADFGQDVSAHFYDSVYGAGLSRLSRLKIRRSIGAGPGATPAMPS